MTLPCDNLVLFDGVCHLCCGSVQFIIKRDPQARFHFASLQSNLGRAICQERGMDPDQLKTMLLLTRTGAYLRSDAAIEIARRLGGPWTLAAVLKVIPRFVRDGVYNLIARNRYRWFGRMESCLVPTSNIRQRFLA